MSGLYNTTCGMAATFDEILKCMKSTCLLILLFYIAVPLYGQAGRAAAGDINKLKWIEGTWVRTNNKAGQSGEEKWVMETPRELLGYGFTMKGTDTLFVEKMRILFRGDRLCYVADVPENQKPVYFELTEITATGFICENPAHDFPKKITYEHKGEVLKATISGDGKAIDYFFRRK